MDVIISDGEIYRRQIPFTVQDVQRDAELFEDSLIDGAHLTKNDLMLIRALVDKLTTYKTLDKKAETLLAVEYIKKYPLAKEKDFDKAYKTNTKTIITDFILSLEDEAKFRTGGTMLDPQTFCPILAVISMDGLERLKITLPPMKTVREPREVIQKQIDELEEALEELEEII